MRVLVAMCAACGLWTAGAATFDGVAANVNGETIPWSDVLDDLRRDPGTRNALAEAKGDAATAAFVARVRGEPLVRAEDDSPAERPDPLLRLLAAEDLERVLRKRVQPTHLEYGADMTVRGEDDGPPAPERPFLKKRLVGGLHGGVSP